MVSSCLLKTETYFACFSLASAPSFKNLGVRLAGGTLTNRNLRPPSLKIFSTNDLYRDISFGVNCSGSSSEYECPILSSSSVRFPNIHVFRDSHALVDSDPNPKHSIVASPRHLGLVAIGFLENIHLLGEINLTPLYKRIVDRCTAHSQVIREYARGILCCRQVCHPVRATCSRSFSYTATSL